VARQSASQGVAARHLGDREMARLMRRHALVTFFLLVFIITWVVWVPRASGTPLGVVGQAWTWAPAIAALLAAALTGGRGALRELGARLVHRGVGCKCTYSKAKDRSPPRTPVLSRLNLQ
jgi:hypothetical protein